MKYIKYISVLSLLVATSACTGDYEDINTNPNKVTVGGIMPSGMIEPVILYGTNNFMSDDRQFGNEIAQVTVAAASNVREEHRYNLGDANFKSVWNDCYKYATNALHMYDLAVAQNDVNYQAIGLTMKVYYMQVCCDLFGGIAYTDAFHEGRLKIDTQKEAYEAMMADLEKANSLYNNKVALEKSERDRIYYGDINKWKKFTNTLHLRLLMRVSGRNTAFSPTVAERINTILDNPTKYPVLESNADNTYVHYPGGESYYRNYYNTTDFSTDNGFSGEHHVSEQFLSMTVFNNDGTVCDPRLRIWAKPRAAADYKWYGAVSGCTKAYAVSGKPTNNEKDTFLHYETLVRDTNVNQLITYDELLFIKAEAAFNGWIAGSAEDYYNAAVTASCLKWNDYGQYAAFPVQAGGKWTTSTVEITASDIEALLANEKVKYNNTYERIAEQKWVSLFWVAGFQQYSEMRRTGYPDVTIGKGTVDYDYTKGLFMARMEYPLVSIANNKENYLAAIQAMGGSTLEDDTMILPVWWSGQAVAKDAGNPWPHSFRTLKHGDK